MDTQVERIVQKLLTMTPEERKEVLSVVDFLLWRDRGGIKTDEISEGENLLGWTKAHEDDKPA